MNRIYKVIWSKARNCYVVVSEIAKHNGKCSSSLNKKIIASFLAAGLVTTLPMSVEAHSIINGESGTITRTGPGSGVMWGKGTASGPRTTAFGENTNASTNNATAFGNSTTARQHNATSFGVGTYADSRQATAFGAYTYAGTVFTYNGEVVTPVRRVIDRYLDSSDPDTTTPKEAWVLVKEDGTFVNTGQRFDGDYDAKGDITYSLNYQRMMERLGKSTASGDNQRSATAFGEYSIATGQDATAFGYRSAATAWSATAWGHETAALGKRSTAFGVETWASGNNATAFGYRTEATNENSTAWGSNTEATGTGATAWGAFTKSGGDNSTAWGKDSEVGSGSLTYGGETYTNLSIQLTTYEGYDEDGSYTQIGHYYVQGRDKDGKLVTITEVDDDGNEWKWKYNGTADQAERDKVKEWIKSKGGTLAGDYSTAFGHGSKVDAENALGALGGKVEAAGTNSAAIGKGATVSVRDTVALGSNSVADRDNVTGKTTYTGYNVGTETRGTANTNYTTGGKNAWVATDNAIAVGNGSTVTRQITGVAAGYEDTDAVNVAQLKVAAALKTDNRNVGLIVNNENKREIVSPYIHVDGVEAATQATQTIATYDRLTTEKNRLESEKTALENEKTTLETALTTLNDEKTALDDALAALDPSSPEYWTKYTEIKTALEVNQTQINEKQAEIDAKQAEADAKQTEITNTGNAITALQSDYDTAQTTVEDFAQATGENAVAIGKKAIAAGDNSVAVGIGNKVYAENSLAFGNNNVISSTATNSIAMGNSVVIDNGATSAVAIGDTATIDVNASYATAIGHNALAEKSGSVALGSDSLANRDAGIPGYDFRTGKQTELTTSDWVSGAAAISVGDPENGITRQITGVAAGSKDTDAVNVAQLKKTVWNIGLAAEGGTVKNPTDGYSLNVKTTVVGNGKNKVQFVAGKGITLTSKRHTTDSLYDTYGIAISTRFEELETTPDNVATAIYYDGIRYTIASGGSSAPSKVTTDHRALNVESIQIQKLNDQGNPEVDQDGNPVMEEYRSINSPYIHINGLQDPNNPYKDMYVAPEYQANAAGENAIAIGREADALYTNSIAIGHLAEAGHSDKRAVNTVALGYRAHALANNSVSVGTAAFATGNRSIAIGVSNVVDTETLDHNDQRAWAAGQGSMVLGNEARAVTQAIRYNINNTGNSPIDYSTNDAIALGTRADARALNAIALGGNMSYTDSEGKVTYGSPKGNARDFGATVGEGAKSAIAIGGAYGSQKTDSTGAVTGIKSVTYAAATSYGAKGIAIGSGALIANNEDYLDLQRLIDNPDYQDLKKTYNNTRHAFTVAEREYNKYLASLNGNIPTDEEDPIYKKLKDLKGSRDSAKRDYDLATGAFTTEIKKKIELEEKNASTVEDAIAIGAGSRTGIKGGIALGSQATAGYLDRSGTESALTGYDMHTGTGYFGSESDDPTWKATHGALSIGALSTTNPSKRTDNVTRRITNVAAGVFDRDAVNVAQLKRATTFTSDNRNMAIGSDEQGHSKIQSPFAHFEGVAQMSEAISITEYTKNAYTAKVNTERANINTRITEFQKAIAELNVRLDGDGTTENIGLRAKLSLVPESNTQLQKNYQQLIKDIEYEKALLSNKITALNKELTNLPSDAGSAYDAAVGLVAQQAHAYGTDSMAVGKLSKASGKGAIAIGTGDDNNGSTEEADWTYNEASGDKSIAIGSGNTASGEQSIAIGSGNEVTGNNSGAFGDPSVINGDNSYSVGNNNEIATEKTDVFALGNNITKVESNSVFLGSNSAYVQADYDTTGGTTAGRSHYNSMIINDRTYDFAGGDRTAGVVSVGGGTVEGKVITRRIQNVAPGLISAESTDAINGSQLYQAMQALSIEVKADEAKSTKVDVTYNPAPDTTGGGTTGGTTGGGTAGGTTTGGTTTGGTTGDTTGGTTGGTTTADTTPSIINLAPAVTYEVKASTTELVLGDDSSGDTKTQGNLLLRDLKEDEADNDPKSYKYQLDLNKDIDLGKDGSVTTGDTVMNNDGLTVGDTTVARDRVTVGDTTMNNDGLTVGDTTVARDRVKVGDTNVNSDGVTIAGGPSMTKTGIDAAGNKITNVQAGTDPTDAVNVSQLRDFAAQTNQNITNVDSRARKGVAGAAALAALHPLDFDPDDKLTFAAGVGNYRGETAAAIGAFYRPDEKVMFSIGGSMGNGENVVNAGVSFSLDRTPRVTGSRTALTKEVVQLREQVARQDARLARQDAQIEKLTALVMKLAGNEGMEALSDTVGTAVPMKAPALFPDNLDNKWAYDFLEDLEQRGYIHGYAGRSLTRDEFAAALDRAMAGGAKLDERLIKEFEPELSHVRVVHIEGKGEDEGKSYERPRASHDKLEDKHEIEKKHFRVKEKKVTSKS